VFDYSRRVVSWRRVKKVSMKKPMLKALSAAILFVAVSHAVSDHLKTYFSESLPGVSESPFVA
jgi:hypothetical protein